MPISLDQPLLVEVSGSESGRILQNLTTNNLQGLPVGTAVESCITDVRGWVMAHGMILHYQTDRWWIVGQHPEPAKLAAHIDRYIIREDAKVVDLSQSSALQVVLSEASQPIQFDSAFEQVRIPFNTFDPAAELVVKFASAATPQQPLQTLESDSSENALIWDRLRIPRLWPKMGVDIWDKCIPQELDRTSQAISFTKGCYLGQETIARLDALGQIQKKLSLLQIEKPFTDTALEPGIVVYADEKPVGSVTSSTMAGEVIYALAVLKRGYFQPGCALTCGGSASRVIAPVTHCT